MYSQDAISGRRSGRPEPTEEMIWGLACIICGTDYRHAPTADARVVSHRDDRQLLACQGVCARMASGSVTGVDEAPDSLAERMRRYEAEAETEAEAEEAEAETEAEADAEHS